MNQIATQPDRTRQGLAPLMGRRARFRGTVKAFGRTSPGKPPAMTILVTGIRNATTSERLTDHVWFKAGTWSADLMVGDLIDFDADVIGYVKGYQGRKGDVVNPIRADWKLEDPSDAVVRYNVKRLAA